jgi:hypothetical protein
MIGKGVEDINVKIPNDVNDSSEYGSTFNVYLAIVVRDAKGNIIKVHKQRSHSPTYNFRTAILPEQWYKETGTSASWTNRAGTTFSYTGIPNGSNTLISYPNSGTNYWTFPVGIMVGSGQQSNPASAYNLAAPIANGSGAGQLIYQNPVPPSQIMVNGNSAYFYIEQTYINQSGGTITITEVGIFVQIYLVNYNNSSHSNQGYLLMWYDVLSSAISVPNGGSVTIYYTFTVNP